MMSGLGYYIFVAGFWIGIAIGMEIKSTEINKKMVDSEKSTESAATPDDAGSAP